MNIKKLFSVAAVVTFLGSTFLPGLALAATPDTELGKAYEWAYANGITTKDTYEAANMTAPITRAEMAKMLSNYAKKFQEKTPDTSATCNFNDTASVGGDLAVAIVESCQLGIMGQGINAFRPYDTITRAEFGTALSRVLWDKTYEGGTPYYAGHLNALKAAGIMTVIANAETMKEVRGYVMLMLMRSENETPSICEETDVKVICAVEEAAEEYKDCPAACRKDNNKEEDKTDEKVRSGDLEVSASAGNTKILINGTSDLDTLTFKSSEEVEITKVILERYGYSTNDDVDQIWLENEEGTVISNVYEGLDSKGQAKLTIKKDYRKVDGTYNATIVLKAKGAAGKTLGFKVVDVDSTAKNLNVDNYKPYTYEMVDYKGAAVTVTARGTTKEYNWESGELYEIAKFKVKAPSDSAINVKGFTLSLNGNNSVDINRYLDKAEATVDGKDVAISYEVNKDDQLVVSFKKNVEIEAKANVEFTVKASLSDDFNDYGNDINLSIAESSDFNALDSKTESRVTIDTLPNAWPTYTFKGGKAKLTNTKLGNVDGAQASNDIVIAAGNLTLAEDIKGTLQVKVSGKAVAGSTEGSAYAIQAMRVSVGGDEYEGKLVDKGTNDNYNDSTFEFANIELSDGGKVEFRVDVRDVDTFNGEKLTFGLVAGKTFSDFKYVENKNKTVDIAGSISFSPLTIQAAKASLTNTITKDVEFKKNEVTRKAVFEGTYSAKKGDLKLNEFTVTGPAFAANNGTVTFYLIVDGDEVADAKLDSNGKATSTFSNVEIEAEKSVKLVLEAEIDAKNDYTGELGKYELSLKGEDENGNVAGEAKKTTTKLKVVEVGAVNVSTATSKKDILRRASNVVVAEFTVKPANNASEVDLDNIQFTLVGTKDYDGSAFTADDITVTINGVTEDYVGAKTAFTYEPTTTVGTSGVTVKVELNEEARGVVSITNLNVNKKLQSGKEFVKSFYPAVAKISKQEDLNGTTRYTISLDKDDDVDVKDFRVYNAGGIDIGGYNGEFSDGDKFSIAGTKDVVTMIEKVTYKYSDSTVAGACSKGTLNGTTCDAVTDASIYTAPVVEAAPVYTLINDVAIDAAKTYYTAAADTSAIDATHDGVKVYTAVTTPDVANIGTYYELTTAYVAPVAEACSEGTLNNHACDGVDSLYSAGYATATVLKDDLADYFKIGSNEEDLKVFKL